MAVSDNYAPTKTIGNGVTVAFTASWNVISAAYIRVYLETVATGIQVLQVRNTDYTLTFNENGLTVDFTISAAPPNTKYVIIARSITQDQVSPYKTSQGFQGAVIENSLDKLTSMTQDLQDQLNRTPKLPIGSSITDLPLPIPVAGRGLVWNSDADGLENSEDGINDIITNAGASAAAAAASAAASSSSASSAAASVISSAANAAAALASKEAAANYAFLANNILGLVNVYNYGAVGDNSADDTAAINNACAAAASLNTGVYLAKGNFKVTSDIITSVPIIGICPKLSRIYATKRLVLDSTDDLYFGKFHIESTMASGVGTSSQGAAVIYGSNVGDRLVFDEISVEHLTSSSVASASRLAIEVSTATSYRFINGKIKGGTQMLHGITDFVVTGNELDANNQGLDGTKIAEASNYGVIANNHIKNTFDDGVDTYTSGAYIIVANNTFHTIGYNGIQCKTIYRFSPYSSGSSDQSGQGTNDHVMIANNIFTNVTMTNVTGAADAGAIYCLFDDERFTSLGGAANNGSGLIRITANRAHGLSTSDKVRIRDMLGTTEANGTWTITVINSTTFDLQGSTFSNTYVALGNVTYSRTVSGAVTHGGLIQLTVTGHGLTTGNIVQVESVGGTTEANATWTVTVIDANTVDLQGSTFTHAYTSGGALSLVLTIKNAPHNYVIANNIISDVCTAPSGTTGAVAGIFSNLSNASITGNSIVNVYKGDSSASYSGSSIVVGQMRGSLPNAYSEMVSICGNTGHGENAGISITSAIIKKLSVVGNTFGYNPKTGASSVYGLRMSSATQVTDLTIDDNIFVGSTNSCLAQFTSNLITRGSVSMNNFTGEFDWSQPSNDLTMIGNIFNGKATIGNATVATTGLIFMGNNGLQSSSATSAIIFNFVNGATITGNRSTGGREAFQIANESTNYIFDNNMATGLVAYAITGAITNGAGLVRITSSGHNMNTNDWVTVSGIVGTTEANGTWQVIKISSSTYDLVGSTFTNLYVSGGTASKILYQSNVMSSVATAHIGTNFTY